MKSSAPPNTPVHFLNIASTLTPANGAMQTLLTDLATRLTTTLGSAPAGHLAAPEQLHELAYREASTMAYADAFRTIMVALLITTPLALLLRNVGAPQAPSTDA